MSFFSTGSSGSAGAFISSRRSGMAGGLRLRKRRFDAGEEEPGNDEPDPDDEAEQRDDIDRRELGQALLPQFVEVRHDADRKEGEGEEDHGRARIAPPVAIAAATPQIDIPEASGADHSRLKPNPFRAMR